MAGLLFLALCILPASSFLGLRGSIPPPRYQPVLQMRKSERDLKVMSLVQLKDLAASLGVAPSSGHKGRKATWIEIIVDAQDCAPAAAANVVGVGSTSAVTPVNEAADPMMAYLQAHPNQLGLLASLCQPGAPAETYLNDMVTAGAATVAPPSEEESYGVGDETRDLLSKTMGFLQESLLVFGDVEEDPEEDPLFIAEGRRLLALERFPVRHSASEAFLVEALWAEVAGLVAAGPNKGSLMLLPKYSAGDIKNLLETDVKPALYWLGLGNDLIVEGYRMSQVGRGRS